MIICFILITKQLILCGQCKNIHADKLTEAERFKNVKTPSPIVTRWLDFCRNYIDFLSRTVEGHDKMGDCRENF